MPWRRTEFKNTRKKKIAFFVSECPTCYRAVYWEKTLRKATLWVSELPRRRMGRKTPLRHETRREGRRRPGTHKPIGHTPYGLYRASLGHRTH